MSTTTEPHRRTTPPRGEAVRRGLAWVLLAAWAAVLVAVVLTASREESWDHLRSAVQDGGVDEVTLVGDEIPVGDGSGGFSRLEVRWREGGLLKRTEVLQRVGSGGEEAQGEVQVVRGSVTDELRRLAPGLQVDRQQLRGGGVMEVLGLRVEDPAASAAYLLFLVTVVMLVLGPEPERATRWGWFWLFAISPPLACTAYLVLGGMLRRQTRPAERRLSGGWAFLALLVLGGAGTAASR